MENYNIYIYLFNVVTNLIILGFSLSCYLRWKTKNWLFFILANIFLITYFSIKIYQVTQPLLK
jgi:hypothetical protein